MRATKMLLCGCLAIGVIVATSYAKSPIPIEGVAPIDDLEAEAEGKLAQIEDRVKAVEFEKAQEKLVQWSGMLALVGQAIAEHPEGDTIKIQGPALRDAALNAQAAEDLPEFQAALAEMKAAYAGLASADAETEYSWGELIGMYEMMEEMNDRQAAVQSSVRRPKGTQKERLNAVALTLLSIAMHEDENWVFDEPDIADWQRISKDYIKLTKELAGHIDAKNSRAMKVNLFAGKKLCNECHDKYRG